MPTPVPFDLAAQLKGLKHERKNQGLHRLPPNVALQRRPLNHAPITDGRTGAKVPKVVYVSRRTPIVAAVKRVKKMLRDIEQRALNDSPAQHRLKDVPKAVAQANARLAADKEEVLVKASGRAMEQALRIGEWFRTQEKEILCQVEVRTGNVSVVDDIVEVAAGPETDAEGSEDINPSDEEHVDEVEVGQNAALQENSGAECGETTLELLGATTKSTGEQGVESPNPADTDRMPNESAFDISPGDAQAKKPLRRKKRKRPMYDQDDVPEARLRWVKTVEVAISLQV